MIGQTIAHYKILEKLGEGGMGVVYKAKDLKLDRIVALKFLSPLLTANEAEKKRFEHEARAVSALDHPNICTFYELGKTDRGQLFIAMAYYEGHTVKDKVVDRPLPLSEALDIAIAVAQGLSKAHEKGVTHRDIKSENVIVTNESGVKIMDFGIAKIVGASTLTKTGATLGTVPYMSPEQARGDKLDYRTDIWSFGMVVYEMITGRLPFKSDYKDAVIYSILTQDPEPVTALRTGVPMELERIIGKCLEKKPSDRYQHMDEVIVDLRKVRVGSKTDEQEIPAAQRFHWYKWYLAGGALLLISVLLLLFYPKSKTSNEGIHSIAVLPLENLSGDPDQEYFADGMTEALITDLAKISAIRVISRASVMHFKGTKKTIPEIAKELNVDAVVEGSVQRSGDRVRITAQLLHAPTDRHLWAESYERNMTDALALQSELALAIVKEIRAKLTPQEETHLTSARPVNTEAYNSYLLGLFFSNRRTETALRKSIEYFEESVTRDPSFAVAFAALADAHALLGDNAVAAISTKEAFSKAKAAVARALGIDPSLAEAHASLAHLKFHDFQWSESEREFRKAIELNPNYSLAHNWYALFLASIGKQADALTEIRRAQELDPLSLVVNTNVGIIYYLAHEFNQAIDQLKKSLELDPSFVRALLFLGRAYEQTGAYHDAVAAFQKALTLSPDNLEVLASLSYTYATSGRTKEAQNVLGQLQQQSRSLYVSPYHVACIYAALNEPDNAYRWLEKAYDEQAAALPFLSVDPRLSKLHSDRRFVELLKKIGLESVSEAHTQSSNELPKTTVWQNSIAVLPFKNISPDKEQDYFCDGMTEQLITNLTNLPNVKVIARTSVMQFKNTDKTIQQIAQELGVAHILEGSVRKAGNKIRVTAQLIKADDASHLWAKDYDRQLKDIFVVQDDVSNAIVEALKINLTSGQRAVVAKRYTENTEAYQLYLKGRYYWNKRRTEEYQKAIQYFKQALEQDPNYALAYAGLADSHAFLGDVGIAVMPPRQAFQLAESDAVKALELDSTLTEAYSSLGHIKMHQFRWHEAEIDFQHAIRLNPNYALGHHFYSIYLSTVGSRLEEALREAKEAQNLDPLSLLIRGNLIGLYANMRQFDIAIAQANRTFEIDSTYVQGHLQLGRAYVQMGKYREAFAELQKAIKIGGETNEHLIDVAFAYAKSGNKVQANRILTTLLEKSKHTYVDPARIAQVYVGLEDKDRAFAWLQKGFDDGSASLVFVKFAYQLQPLRSDQRYDALLKKMGLEK